MKAPRILLLGALTLSAALAHSKPLIDLTPDEIGAHVTANAPEVTFTPEAGALDITIAPDGPSFPGITIKPDAPWNLSEFGHVEAKVTNTGPETIYVSLRVDNENHGQGEAWNAESTKIPAGATRSIKVIFGYQFGYKPGFDLDSSLVSQVLLFAKKKAETRTFRLESLTAGGKPGEKPEVNPDSVRTKPADGHLLGGPGEKVAPATITKKDPEVAVEAVDKGGSESLLVTLPGTKGSSYIGLAPAIGRWDFAEANAVRVKVKNTGNIPILPTVQVLSGQNLGTDVQAPTAPLKPDEEGEILVPFASKIPWQGPSTIVTKGGPAGDPGTGTPFQSDKASEIRFVVEHDGGAQFEIISVTAVVETVTPPEWVGKRPPVEGDWKLTFEEEFEGTAIDPARWRIYGPNYWGRKELIHWSKDNVIVADGRAKLRLEKKTGFHNDDPASGHESPYASGFLDTYGLWAQRYGYFEARMKLPTAPGIWPAFWLMPDRGPQAGEQWRRQSTKDGGMEVDIMEHLTRWGPYRYHIAAHWDGYAKEHKSIGTSNIYLRPDAEGYFTSGLLWLPGLLVFYVNGEEVGRWENPLVGDVQAVVKFTLPIGGWDNNPLDDKTLPTDFVIDYVKVWQRKDLASSVDGFLSENGTAKK